MVKVVKKGIYSVYFPSSSLANYYFCVQIFLSTFCAKNNSPFDLIQRISMDIISRLIVE
jgi:hypothetical protein